MLQSSPFNFDPSLGHRRTFCLRGHLQDSLSQHAPVAYVRPEILHCHESHDLCRAATRPRPRSARGSDIAEDREGLGLSENSFPSQDVEKPRESRMFF